MTQPTNSGPIFAKLMEVNGEQILFEVLPAKDPKRRAKNFPDVMVTADLGWSRYEARVSMKLNEDGLAVEDINAYLLGNTDQEKANEQMASIKAEFGGPAMCKKMLDNGEYDLGDPDDVEEMNNLIAITGNVFAKLIDLDGRQVLATTSEDLGLNNDEEGLVVKTSMLTGGVMRTQFEGMTLDDFTETFAQECVDRAITNENRKVAKPK